MNAEKIPVTVIVGPTAVGKTEFAIRYAQMHNAEIISADSRYFYRGLDIGTAKPSQTEMCGVPHHLIDVSEPDDIWSLSRFQSAAQTIIAEIYSRKKNVLVTGGTGQYIRALTDGWQVPLAKPHEPLRIFLEKWADEIGTEAMYEKLRLIDPQAVANIDHHQNVRRTIRALEVILTSGEKFSTQRTAVEVPYNIRMIGLIRRRAELYERIDRRIDQMISGGLIEEVKGLLDQGFSPQLPSMSAIGYRELIYYFQGKATLDEAVMLIRRFTRNYVRRQANWFRLTDPKIQWIDLSDQTPPCEEQSDEAIHNHN